MSKISLYCTILFLFLSSAILRSNQFMVLTVNEAITPATSSYINDGIYEAEQSNLSAVIILLNTPGGLLDATRDIVSSILNSKVPICVYVSPSGSRAGSAGVFITIAAHISAMAHSTNIGAAHPIGIDGSSDSTILGKKIENDAVAFIRSIANRRSKNSEWAERAVRYSESITDEEALNLKVIDLVAKDIDELMDQLNGRIIEINNGNKVTINSINYKLIYRNKNIKEELLSILSNPNLIYILILIGIWGIIYEFKSPGAIFPGVIGAISLLIVGYSMQLLPINYLGVALIFLSLLLFITEIFVHSYALLTIVGIFTFVFGSLILIDSPEDFMQISLELIIFSTTITGLLFGFIIWLGIKAQKDKHTVIVSELIGKEGYALLNFKNGTIGKVHINGEIWDAIANQEIYKNDKVKVEKINGFNLVIKKNI